MICVNIDPQNGSNQTLYLVKILMAKIVCLKIDQQVVNFLLKRWSNLKKMFNVIFRTYFSAHCFLTLINNIFALNLDPTNPVLLFHYIH